MERTGKYARKRVKRVGTRGAGTGRPECQGTEKRRKQRKGEKKQKRVLTQHTRGAIL